MAKQSNSTATDPAALAFSAVENALRDSVFSLDNPEDGQTESAAEKPEVPVEREQTAEKISSKSSNVANDDRYGSSSRLMYNLQARPSSVPIWVAILMSILWTAGTGLIGWLRFGDQLAQPGQMNAFLGTADFAGLLAIAALPVLGFFAVAILVRRAQDLRIAATSMTQAAIRLAEPETTAADKVASVGQAVRREVNALGDGLERALSRAGELEVMVHNEVTSLERTYSDNETRLRSLIQELAAQRESVITNSDRVRNAIAEAHTLMIEDIDNAGARVSDSIVGRGEDVRLAIEASAETLHSSFGERSTKFLSVVDDRTAELISIVDESADKLNLTLDDRSTAIGNNFEKRTSELATVLDGRMSNLTEELDSRAISVSQVIDDKTKGLADALKDGGDSIISDLESRGYAMSGALEAIGSRIVNDIGGRATSAERTLNDITDRLDETMSIKLNSMDSRMQTALIEIGGAMEQTTEEARDTLVSAGSKTISQMEARVEEVSLVISSRLQEVDAVIGDKGEKIIIALNTHTTEFSSSANLLETALEEKTSRMDEVITKHQKELTGEISARTKEFAEKLGTRTQQLSDAMGSRTKEFGEVLDTRTHKLSETIQTRTLEFGDTLTERTQTMSDALSNETVNLTDKLAFSTSELAKTVDERTQEIAGIVNSQGETVRARIDDALNGVTETMDGRASHVSELITSKIAEVNDSIGREVDTAVERLSDAESGVTARIDSAAENISESAKEAANTIETGVDTARRSITDMVDQRLGTLPEAITARADIAADRLAALNENINTSIVQSMSELESGADRIEETIGTRIANASLAISNDVEQTAARMDVAVRTALDQVREAAQHIEELVEVRAIDTAKLLGDKVEEMNEALESKTNSFAELISTKSDQLEGALQGHSNILRDALAETSQGAEEVMSQSTARILSDVNSALTKLNDSNMLLQQVLESSTTNLAKLEGSVADQTSSYANTVREAFTTTEQAGQLVSEHVAAFQTTIGSITSEFGTMLGDLDIETININKAANSLTSAGNFTIDTLKTRQDAMEALATSFTARADDIDERMRTFAHAISDTVGETEQRLLVARRAMEDALDSTTTTVADRLDAITEAADGQGQRVGEQLRNTQQSLVAEMHMALEEATRRFGDTADAMRTTAKQVGSELEATRSELQRGVMELPEETKASAAAMRRVVAEQIEALNELNAIVRAQPSTHDISARRQPRREQPQEPPRQQQEILRQPAPERRDSDQGNSAIAELLRTPQTQQQERAIKAQAIPSDNLRDENGSWLRDVLRNASAKQQAGSQRNVNLSNLTDEVTRAMDENALADAWQRYRSGESNVFSRRIYTLTGQGTYDEVRKKFQRDQDFTRNAAAYMDEFEQLLTKAASDPRAAVTMQDHLISDRGKVYTMLAHASGRLS